MFQYIIRRLLYAIPILIGVNIITFSLFFLVNTPDDMARLHLGDKYVTQADVDNWKQARGYADPLFYNAEAKGVEKFSQTLFFEKSLELFVFNFGISDDGRSINYEISQRMWPSLSIAIPVLIIGLIVNVAFALGMIFFRHTYLDTAGVILCVVMLSISSLFYIIGTQYLFSKLWHLAPISGYAGGWESLKFIALPIFAGIIAHMGSHARWYRSIFLEELSKDYVRTARAKGLSEWRVLFIHILKNGLIPILTGVVVLIPGLFMGSLLLESFFGIPGLGSYTIDAINGQDFAIVRSMVFLGAVFYLLGLILTDISYVLVDPRIRLK
jgi:peptide/nickel transport system permease protein